MGSIGIRLPLAVLGGLIATLAFPPFGWEPAALVGVALLFWLVSTASGWGNALWSGYLFGLAFFASLLWWVATVELVGFIPLVLVMAVSFLGVAAVVHYFRTAPSIVFIVAAAGSLALVEFLRVRWPVGGFPWGLLGYTVSSTPLRPASQWFGATGWSVILAATAAVVVLVMVRRMSWWALGWAAGVVATLGIAGAVWPAVAEGPDVAVTIVQGNSPCPQTRCPGERWAIYQSHLQLTEALSPGSDLVVWPESSLGGPADPLTNQEVRSSISAQASRLGAVLLAGGDLDAGPDHFLNANLVFDQEGQLVGQYRKRHPVPFGEYVPLRFLLDWIPAIDRVPRDMLRGQGPVLFELKGIPFGSVISYEGTYARYERQLVAQGARFLVVATNESSFGDAPVSDQFLDISRLRAAELGVDIVHAAITGRSAIVHADGRITGPTGLFETEVLSGGIASREAGLTVYARVGDWLQVAAMGALVLLVAHRLYTGWRGRREQSPVR